MATVAELSDPYANFMVNPASVTEADVCSRCTTFTDGYPTCYPCGFSPDWADAIVPISYSIHYGQLHNSLAQYKRSTSRPAQRNKLELAAVLWRFLGQHERCVATAAGTEAFDLTTTVPSGSAERDEAHPLRSIVGNLINLTSSRYERLLTPGPAQIPKRTVDPDKYVATMTLTGESVLLIDDTWTTGASAESAAASLKHAGAGAVGVVVIGRHIHEDFKNNASRLASRPRPFNWDICALE